MKYYITFFALALIACGQTDVTPVDSSSSASKDNSASLRVEFPVNFIACLTIQGCNDMSNREVNACIATKEDLNPMVKAAATCGELAENYANFVAQ